jgi:DNA repair protein RadC
MIDGIGENAATIIKLILDVNRRYILSRFEGSVRLATTQELAQYCMGLEFGRPYETLYMICLSIQKNIRATYMLDEGTLDNVRGDTRKFVSHAITSKAYSVALTHNHPEGTPIPSEQDLIATQLAIRALRAVNVKFEDHIIVGSNNLWISMRESKYI